MSMTHHQKEQILKVVEYYMTPELRERIMREVPVAYNAWVGYAVVEVKEVDCGESSLGRLRESNAILAKERYNRPSRKE